MGLGCLNLRSLSLSVSLSLSLSSFSLSLPVLPPTPLVTLDYVVVPFSWRDAVTVIQVSALGTFDIFWGGISAEGMLYLGNPNWGSNSGIRKLEPRISGPNLGVEFGVFPVENPSRNSHPKFHIKHRKLNGIVSCDSVAVQIRIRIVRCQRPAKRQKHKPCETQARLPPHFSLLIVRNLS